MPFGNIVLSFNRPPLEAVTDHAVLRNANALDCSHLGFQRHLKYPVQMCELSKVPVSDLNLQQKGSSLI
jgi:hypothetical protein